QDTLSQPSVTLETHEQEKNPKSSPYFTKIVDDEYYQWYDCRPDSPIPLKDLIPSFGNEHSDPSHETLNEQENVLTKSEGSDLEVEEEFGFDLEHENEDFEEDGVQREAVVGASLLEEGRVDGGDQLDENGYLSDYANSEEDELTPDEDDDGEGNARSRRGNRMVVPDGTDWTAFEWRVGHRFPNRKTFKDAIARYAIFQGRNLSSILAVVSKVLPKAEHRHCSMHIYAHWHKTSRGDEFKQLFWRAAKAYNMADFNDAQEDMGKVNSQSVDAFKSYNPRLFCRAFMNTDMKVDVIVNNLAETFNGYIITARTKHLLYMLEEIRTILMQRLATKKMEVEKNTTMICPRIQAKLEKAKRNLLSVMMFLPPELFSK
ncbi:Endoplasmic reticulum protein SC65, partial [Bienertia sinuspersici]